MTARSDLLAQKAEIDRKLGILNRVGEDTFNLGTVVVFSAASGVHWYYRKVAEETWRDMQSQSGAVSTLAEWVLEAEDANVGYFEIYALTPAQTPFYASS